MENFRRFREFTDECVNFMRRTYVILGVTGSTVILVILLCGFSDILYHCKGAGGEDMSTFRAVFVTVPTLEVAKTISHGLVGRKLAACVNIVPQITSVYEWEGKINEDSELLLLIKTQNHLLDDLSKFVKDNHPYDVPEVIAVPIESGSQPYLDWIKQVTDKYTKA